MPRLSWLADAARATGYPVTEVQGWESRGSTTFNPRALIWHHTAGAATGDMPSLNILVNGRSGLPGPLSQYGLGRSGRIYVVAAGRANHAGSGGWNSLTGNGTVIGIEAEHVGKIPPGWPAVQMDAYRKLSAQILTRLGVSTDFMCGHKEWAPTRKVDPIGLNMDDERTRVAALMGGDDLDTIIQVLKGQNMAFYRAVNNKTGGPFANADFWGSDYQGTPKPTDADWQAHFNVLFGAVLQAGVFTEGGGMNEPRIRELAVESGREVFVEKGQPVVIRGT